MASSAPSQETGAPPVSTPSQESGVRAVILPYPQNAIARRFIPPMPKATHPAILKAQAFA
jgi:nitrate/nitrite transport system permease protein